MAARTTGADITDRDAPGPAGATTTSPASAPAASRRESGTATGAAREITLVAGGPRRGTGGVVVVGTRRVVIQVAVIVLLVLLAVAATGTFVVRRVAEREAINDAARSTGLLAEAVVQPALTDGVPTGESTTALATAIRQRVLLDPVVHVKVWDRTGRIVWSDEQRLIGRTFELGGDEVEAFEHPATRAETTDLSRPENVFERGQGKLLEVYRPVWTPNGTPLLFETYSRYDEVTSRTSQLYRGFAGIVLSSLLLLSVLLVPVLWSALDRLRNAQRQRESWLRHAVDASTVERRHVAANLHDGVVQDMTATSLGLSGAARRAKDPAVADALDEAARTVRGNIAGLRSLLVDIHPPSLRQSGLMSALDDLASTTRGRGITVDIETEPVGVDDDAAQLIFRVAQETLRNAVTHSGAERIVVGLVTDRDDVVLTVTDDGRGFDPATLDTPEEGHLGTRLIRELAEDCGATLTVRTAPLFGTTWRLVVPG